MGFKACALIYLKGLIAVGSVLDELFTSFTAQCVFRVLLCVLRLPSLASRFDEVKDLKLRVLVSHWDTSNLPEKLGAKMLELASGRIPHAGKIMEELFKRVSASDATASHVHALTKV